MVALIDQVRVTGPGSEWLGTTPPAAPSDDYAAATRFLWAYMRARGAEGGAAEEHDGRRGWLWEGTLSGAVRFLWPELDEQGTTNAVANMRHRLRALGVAESLVSGRGQSQGMFWVADVHPSATAGPVFGRPVEQAPAAPVGDEDQGAAAEAAPPAVDLAPARVNGHQAAELAARTAAMHLRAAELDAREQSLTERDAEGQAFEQFLAKTEAGQNARAAELDTRAAEIDARAAELTHQEAAVIARELQLIARERGLMDWERKLVDRERSFAFAALADQERALAEAARALGALPAGPTG